MNEENKNFRIYNINKIYQNFKILIKYIKILIIHKDIKKWLNWD